MKTIPFNLQLAKKGLKVQTKDGHNARIVCYDRKGDYSIVALIEDKISLIEKAEYYTKDGKYSFNCGNDLDLVLIAPIKTIYMNVYKNTINKAYYLGSNEYDTFEDAENNAESKDYIQTIGIDVVDEYTINKLKIDAN